MLILIFLLIFADFQKAFSDEINGNAVLKMAQCYMDAFYHKPLIPRDDVIPMDEAMNPHLAFSGRIDHCLRGIKSIRKLKMEIFKQSGLKEWQKISINYLKEEYIKSVKKYAPLPNNETSLREWFKGESFDKIYQILSNWQQDNPDKCGSIPSRITRKYVKELRMDYLKDMDHRYNTWRRKLSPFSLLLNSAYLKFAENLIGKLMSAIDPNRNLDKMLNHIRTLISTNISIPKYSFLRKIVNTYDTFEGPYKRLEELLEDVNISESEVNKRNVPKFPKIKRVISLFRHGERLDNNKDLKKQVENTPSQQYEYKGRYYNFDNSPLNKTGEERAMVLNKVIQHLNIKFLLAASYDRTIQTAVKALGDSHKNYVPSEEIEDAYIIESELKIKIEPGFIESMSDCVDRDVGYLEFAELVEHYERLDSAYKPILQRDGLCSLYQEKEARKSDIGCSKRVKSVLNALLKRAEKGKIVNAFDNKVLRHYIDNNQYDNEWILPGEENAENIAIFTHGLVMSSLQNSIGGVFTYSPQTSITKIVELDPSCPIAQRYIAGSSSSSSSTGGNYLENLRLLYMGVIEHFDQIDETYFLH